jgi:hypothetical protein
MLWDLGPYGWAPVRNSVVDEGTHQPDAAIELADKLVTAQYQFNRSLNLTHSQRRPGAGLARGWGEVVAASDSPTRRRAGSARKAGPARSVER